MSETDAHEEAQSLASWYLNGTLETAERLRVEAHLAQCPECRDEFAAERRLMAEFAAAPLEIEHGWGALRERLKSSPARPRAAGVGLAERLARAWRAGGPWLGWGLAAAQILLVLSLAPPPWKQAPRYHALGAPPPSGSANLLVVFRPETPERSLEAALAASGARVVDGPTVADAWVLHVAPGQRMAALESLQRRPDVLMAQPVDAPR